MLRTTGARQRVPAMSRRVDLPWAPRAWCRAREGVVKKGPAGACTQKLKEHSSQERSARVTAFCSRSDLSPHPRAQLLRGSAGFLTREELLDGNLIIVAVGSDVLIDSLDEELCQVGRARRDVRGCSDC